MKKLTKKDLLFRIKQKKLEDEVAKFPPFQRSSWTSRKAAQMIAACAASDRVKILMWLGRCKKKGATDDEISRDLSIFRPTATARRNDLMTLGYVKDSGRLRLSSRKRPCVVWILTKRARVLLNDGL